jgi:hypothetical protein
MALDALKCECGTVTTDTCGRCRKNALCPKCRQEFGLCDDCDEELNGPFDDDDDDDDDSTAPDEED